MVFNMISFRSVSILLFLIFTTTYSTFGWNKNYFILAISLPVASLCSLLILNTAVLYIYIKYFVSPQVHKRKLDNNFKSLRITHKNIWPQITKMRQQENTCNGKPIADDEDINNAFNTLLRYVIRDFIQSWYVKITNSPTEQSFPFAVDGIIRSAAAKLSQRLEQTDLLLVILNKIIPRMTSHISEFRAAEVSLLGKSLERSVTQSDELDLLLASRFRSGKLHKALTTAAMTTKPTEIAYLRHMIERVLPYMIDHKELQSGPVRVVIREIVSNSVLQPVMDMLADPDFWNQNIDAYLGKAIIEQKMVRQLREVIRQHSTHNDMDTEDVMNVLYTADRPEKKRKKKSGEKRKIGPQSQLLSAFMRTGVSTNDWNKDNDYNDHFQKEDDDEEENDDEEAEEDEYGEQGVMYDDYSSNRDGFISSSNRIFKAAYDPSSPTKLLKKKQYGIGSIKMGKRTFQDFLKMIQEEKNLLDLKRVRNDIVTQIRKKKAHIADRDPEEIVDGEKVQDIIVYLNRLGVAKKRVDKRISTLSGEQFDFRKSTSQLFNYRKQSMSHINGVGYSLSEILINTSGLSYFMEFMDRRGDMVKLQFWLIVEGFKSTAITNNEERKTFLQDVKMVYEMYFTETAPHRLHIAEQFNKDLKNAIDLSIEKEKEDQESFAAQIRELNVRLNRIQQHVFWEIEKEHYPYFKRSDLYFKFLASAPPIQNTAIPEEAPGRRSFDESALYTSNINQSIHSNRPASIHESSSSTSIPVIPTPTISTPLKESFSYFSSETAKAPEFSGRARGHQRAMSDSTKSSRFLSFSNMFQSNRLWSNNDTASNLGKSVKAPEETEETEEEEEEEEEEDDQSLKGSNMARLVKSNTVDAVEAELRSILDGSNNMDDLVMTGGETTQTPSPPPSPPAAKKPVSLPLNVLDNTSPSLAPPVVMKSLSASALLLCGTRGIKSTTADPVQNVSALPSWTSSGGTNAISEIEHDSLEAVASTKSPSPSCKSEPLTLDKGKGVDDHAESSSAANIHFAPPGDLMLASKVEQLSAEAEKLTAQEAIVDALIAKAEAQNKLEELRILKKSKTMFRQDLQQIQYQKSQYELQQSENVLMPDRSQVNITSATIGSDKNGEFALYVIEIQQQGADGNYASGWIVARRYSEFFALHQKLKEKHPAVRQIEFPAKWPLLKLQKSFVEARRISLERYLRKLVDDRDICNSQEFRSFLSQQNVFVPGPDTEWPFGNLFGSTASLLQTSSSSSSLQSLLSPSVQNLQKSIAAMDDTQQRRVPNKGFMQHIYKTVAAGIDDMLVGPSMLDLITQRLGEQVMEFDQTNASQPTSSNSSRNKVADSVDISTVNVIEPAAELPDSLKAEGITKFTEPLCDLFIEMFELKDKTNWLRRQAVVIILQQILEGTIERKLRELLKYLSSSSMIVFYFNKITNSLWPNGDSLTFKEARKPEDKVQTREEANRKLSTWLPDLLGNMVGRQNARKGARRLFTVLQNKRLNQDLVYTLLDEFIYALFPEITDIRSTTANI
ncbi:PXA domain-containing protein [Parasitella parasitica]|nr:PXA domain-containing protein [Parasitella parasitica]